jgi:hypothetical protein
MPNAAECRTMTAEEHRLAGMCRHRRRENGLLALEDNEEWLECKRAPQRHDAFAHNQVAD